MYNLQGIIRKGIVNTDVQFERMGYISSNIANYNTNAYKGVRFEQVLDEDGYLDGSVRQDYRQGSMMRTERELDVGLEGPGFIPVTSKAGDVTYTRDGSFKVDKEGYLITNDGHLVGDGIKIPNNFYSVRIKKNGNVEVLEQNAEAPKIIGKIPVVQFQNPEGLKQGDNNKMIATKDSGEPILVKEHSYISQGFLERSNTNIYECVNDLLRLNASMIASFRMMKVVDDMYTKAINLRQ